MLLTREVLDRALHWGAFAIVAVLAGSALMQQVASPSEFPPGFTLVLGVIVTASMLWCGVDAVRSNPRRTALRWWVVLTIGVGVIQAIGRFPRPFPEANSPLTVLLCSSFAVAGFAYGLRVGLAVAVVAPALVGTHIWGIVDGPIVVAAVTTSIAGGVVAALVVDRLQRASQGVEVSLRDAWLERERASRGVAEAQAQYEWDGLVHDKVLGALLLAGRSTSDIEDDAARVLASEAITAISTPTAGGSTAPAGVAAAHPGHSLERDLEASVRRLTDALGMRLTWQGPAHVAIASPREYAALTGALDQAMVNVSRHSGTREVEVSVDVSAELIAATVRDRGRGFVAADHPAGRRGIREGIVGRMERVGGHATVRSTPGAGTVVTVALPRDRGQAGEAQVDASRLDPRARAESRDANFRGIYAIAPPVVAAQATAAWHEVDRVTSVPILVGCIVAALGVAVLLAAAPPRWHRAAAGAVAVMMPLPFVTMANVAKPGSLSWAYWFVGATATIVALVAFRWRRRWALLLAASVLLGTPLAHLWRDGRIWLPPLADAMPQVFVYTAAALAVRAALDNASRSILANEGEVGQARVAAAQAEEAVAVARRRVQELGYAVSAQLHRIVEGGLSPDERARCLTMEAEARDVLVAGVLLDPPLAEAISRARQRRVRVDVSAERHDTAGIEVFRRGLLVALELAPPRSTLRAMWRPDARGRVGSISVVGDLGSAAGDARWHEVTQAPATRDSGIHIDVSAAEEDVLVTFARSD